MHGRLTSTHLVGRVAELAELELALEQASERRPALVLIAGDSGVGKTRLLGEFERRIAGADSEPLILRGEAVPTGDGELPYGPLLGALRPLVRERNEVLAELAPGSRAQLGALLPGLDDGGGRPDRDDPSAQLRLFEALLELIDLLSARHTVVLALEDMHWADRSTRAFVAYLARSLRHERLLVLLTYRSDELNRRHPLRSLVSELERVERTRRLELSPFDRDELSEALTDILGESPTSGLVSRLHMRAEGNPLFTEELLAASLDGRGPAPQSLRDAFMLRIERLSPAAQRAARVIAVGRALSEPVIAEVAGVEGAALQEGLREAVAAQVLVPGDENALSFRHELLREALYEDLLPGERSELHRALAQCLERQAESSPDLDVELAASIAAHYAAAGDQPAALRASIKAARAARSVHAAAEAARLAERGLELWHRVPNAAEVAGMDHVEVALLAARSMIEADRYTRAEHLLTAILEEIDPPADPLRCSAVLELLARTQWELNRGPESVRTAKRALGLLPPGEVSVERADLLGWLARRELLRGRFRDVASDGEEALAAARAADCRGVEADVLNTLGMAQVMLGDVDGGTARLRHAIELANEDGDHESAAYAWANLADMLAIAGRTGEALEVAFEGLRSIPRRLRGSHEWMVVTISELAYLAGDWSLARSHLGPPASELVGRRLIFRLLREAELALSIGEEDAAARALEEAEPLVASSMEPQWIAPFGDLLAELHRRRRDLVAARQAVATALDRIELCTDDVMRVARVSAAGIRVEADIAQRARDLGERREERDAIARARLHLQRLAAAAAEGGPVEAAREASSKAELARARGQVKPAPWARAAERWHAVERPYEEAIAHWRAADAAALAGDRATASEHAASGLKLARRLGSRWLSDELRTLIQRARLQRIEEAAEAGSPPAVAEDPFGLTQREREVLDLIAQGATNRQIGAALFMAEKTASVHVSRILAKLGVRSRTEAAAVAHRTGLLTEGLAAAKLR